MENIEKEENSLAEAYFGPVKALEVTGNFKPEPERLLESLEGPNSVIHLFCRGCGSVTELSQKGLETCLNMENKPIPPVIEQRMYLCSDGCIVCEEMYGNFEIRKI
jgi:hypothetical protein